MYIAKRPERCVAIFNPGVRGEEWNSVRKSLTTADDGRQSRGRNDANSFGRMNNNSVSFNCVFKGEHIQFMGDPKQIEISE